MGRKTNSVSLRLKKTNKDYNHCWYGDILYGDNLSKIFKIEKNFSQSLKTINLLHPKISYISAYKKANVYLYYLDASYTLKALSENFNLKTTGLYGSQSIVFHKMKKKQTKEISEFYDKKPLLLKKRYVNAVCTKHAPSYGNFFSEQMELLQKNGSFAEKISNVPLVPLQKAQEKGTVLKTKANYPWSFGTEPKMYSEQALWFCPFLPTWDRPFWTSMLLCQTSTWGKVSFHTMYSKIDQSNRSLYNSKGPLGLIFLGRDISTIHSTFLESQKDKNHLTEQPTFEGFLKENKKNSGICKNALLGSFFGAYGLSRSQGHVTLEQARKLGKAKEKKPNSFLGTCLEKMFQPKSPQTGDPFTHLHVILGHFSSMNTLGFCDPFIAPLPQSYKNPFADFHLNASVNNSGDKALALSRSLNVFSARAPKISKEQEHRPIDKKRIKNDTFLQKALKPQNFLGNFLCLIGLCVFESSISKIFGFSNCNIKKKNCYSDSTSLSHIAYKIDPKGANPVNKDEDLLLPFATDTPCKQGYNHPESPYFINKIVNPFLYNKDKKVTNKLENKGPAQYPGKNMLYVQNLYKTSCDFWGNLLSICFIKSANEKACALFLAHYVSYFLERKVLFRHIKRQLLLSLQTSYKHKNVLSSETTKYVILEKGASAFFSKHQLKVAGIRISCSGRVGGRSKKAQRSRKETLVWGETGLHVFSSKLDFAKTYAETSFGLVGVQVWVCYK